MKFTVEELTVEIEPKSPSEVQLKRAKLALCKFRCGCGLETLSIAESDIKSLESDRFKDDGTPVRPSWDIVKESHELSKEWNQIHDRAKDFLEYFRAVFLFRLKHRLRSMSSGGAETNLSIECPTCSRSYSFHVSIENPLEPAEELTPVETYRKWGLPYTKELQRVLARYIEKEGWKRGYDTVEDYLRYIASLDDDVQFIKELTISLCRVIDNSQPAKTERTKAWVKDLKDSLGEVQADFEKENEGALRLELENIVDLLKPPGN